MKRSKLVNHIKGSYLKEQYLEAFLVQSAYIEGLLKLFCDYNFWQQTREKLEQKNKMIEEIRKKVSHFSNFELIEFLRKCDLIDENQKKDLHKYREKRNKILHDFVSQMTTDVFETELKEICELGDKIIADTRFLEMEKVIDVLEVKKIESPKT